MLFLKESTPEVIKSWHIFCLKFFVFSTHLRCKQVKSKSVTLHQKTANVVCGLMLLNNLAEPRLTFVHCNMKYIRDIFCSVQRKGSSHEQTENTDFNLTSCKTDSYRKKNLCFSCSWKKLEHIVKVSRGKQLDLDINTTAIFLHIFDAVDALSYPPIISPDLFTKIYYVRFLNIYTFKLERANNMTSRALTANVLPRITLKTGGNVFWCEGSFFISKLYLCNGIQECPKDDDELNCNFGKTIVCSTLFYMTPSKTCKIFMYKTYFPKPGTIQSPDLPDKKCVEHGMLECLHNKLCYSLSQICVYKLNKNDILSPCHFGEHLQLCKSFECNTMFKCPGYYCIFWENTCNARWDCPSGSDESNALCNENRKCVNMFKCKKSEICIHLADICDGRVNCPEEDDEQLCMLNEYKCPPVCECLALAIQCLDVNLPGPIFQQQNPHYLLYIKNCSGFVQDTMWIAHPELFISTIINSGLSVGCSLFHKSKQLVALNFSFNSIWKLTETCFSENINLKVIAMNDNLIKNIKTGTFLPSQKLQILDLSNNCIITITTLKELGLRYLTLLSMNNNNLSALKQSIFLVLNSNLLKQMIFISVVWCQRKHTAPKKTLGSLDVKVCCPLLISG